MRKIYYLLLAILIVGIAACNENSPTNNDNPAQTGNTEGESSKSGAEGIGEGDGSGANTEEIPTIEVPAITGCLDGVFSVGENTKIRFSQGNLQYQASTNTWRFATNQYDTIGSDNQYILESSYKGWIDLFGWSTGTEPTYCRNYSSSPISDFDDWGKNAISNSDNLPNQWRTLTGDEWLYLFHGRINAEVLFGLGSVNGVNGVIILPDYWKLPDGLTFNASTSMGLEWNERGGKVYGSTGGNFSHNTYNDLSQWHQMEDAGAVFLPAAGVRLAADNRALYILDVRSVGEYGEYWSSTEYGGGGAYHLYFYSQYLGPRSFFTCCDGLSVRLVRNIVEVEE